MGNAERAERKEMKEGSLSRIVADQFDDGHYVLKSDQKVRGANL